MKIADWFIPNIKVLKQAGIDSARLDCLILLEDVLGYSRAHLLAHLEKEIPPDKLVILGEKLSRRAAREPIAYIRGFSEFYGRNFNVDRHVLIPRPESEAIIEILKSLKLPVKPRIVDVGTGSGALAITFALEINEAYVEAIEISHDALAVAKLNAKQHNAHVAFYQADLLALPHWRTISPMRESKIMNQKSKERQKNNLLENRRYESLRSSSEGGRIMRKSSGVSRPYDVIVANLPYVANDQEVSIETTFEPHGALYAGNDGLELINRLINQVNEDTLNTAGYLVLESEPRQHARIADIAAKKGLLLQKTENFIQVFRIHF